MHTANWMAAGANLRDDENTVGIAVSRVAAGDLGVDEGAATAIGVSAAGELLLDQSGGCAKYRRTYPHTCSQKCLANEMLLQ